MPQIREELIKIKPGKWRHSRIFEDVGVALEQQVTPTVFWEEWPERDQAFALAKNRAIATMTSWEDHLHEKDMARRSKAKR